jgi:hypothetical protein
MMDTTRATLELLSTFDDAELRATAEAYGIPGTGRLRRRRLLETLSATLDAERLLVGAGGRRAGARVRPVRPRPAGRPEANRLRRFGRT